MSIPSPRTPLGEPTDADRERARNRLSAIHGREVRGGLAVELLAAEYAAAFRAGYEAGRRVSA